MAEKAITVYLSEAEHSQLKSLAAHKNQSMSSLVRTWIMNHAECEGRGEEVHETPTRYTTGDDDDSSLRPEEVMDIIDGSLGCDTTDARLQEIRSIMRGHVSQSLSDELIKERRQSE